MKSPPKGVRPNLRYNFIIIAVILSNLRLGFISS